MVEENRYPQAVEEEMAVADAGGADVAATVDYAAEAASAIARTGREMSSFVGHFAEVAKAQAVVGEAHTVEGHTFVPLATVSVQGGFGMGFGGGGGADEKRNQGAGSGGGAGGGARSSARVIAVADISESGVVVKPVPDVTALALGMMALMGLRMLSRRGSGQNRAARGRFLGMLRRE